MKNFWGVFTLWVKLGKTIKGKKQALLQLSNIRAKDIPSDFDFDGSHKALRDARYNFQKCALTYERAGHTEISERFLILKQLTSEIQQILTEWENIIDDSD